MAEDPICGQYRRAVRRVAEDVFQIALTPRDGVNAYLLGDIVVDAGPPATAKRLLRALQGRAVGAHALTHAHTDHAGASKRLADAFDVPVWVGEHDRGDAESGRPARAQSWARPLLDRFARYEPVPVARVLREGDELGHGFVVLDVPGHSAGHVAFWREADRTLVMGDVLFNLHMLTTARGLREPPRALTPDPQRNRESARRLAALEPALALFGHGPPLRDPAALVAFADTLP
jgi:glyoxylase-like metal-dependent hydrolase (beta-lactamase superfamily II)